MSSEWLLLLGIGLVPALWLVRARKRAASRTSRVSEYHCVNMRSPYGCVSSG
jgi:hypothetical protein